MILLKIDPQGITALPLERDTPRTIDVDAVALEQTMKTMEVEAWHLKICQ
jgi:7,8-dihydro-6-hydroxymethylpterin-pyrophosphokinase